MEELSFTLEEMMSVLQEAESYTNSYKEAIRDLDEKITSLKEDWVSTELGTYEAFIEKYNEKKERLIDAGEYMTEFCNQLNQKIMEYEQSANTIKNSFE